MSKLLLLATALASVSFAQAVAGFGGISGVVRDASGAVVPSAEVVVENSSKGIRRTLVSNDAGVFAAPALVPSTGYSVKVSKAGFRAFEVKAIEILVGQNVNINASLSVESATTQVDITDQAPIVEQTKTGTSQVVNSLQIRDLPINGRRVDSFVLLTPAVVSDGTFGLVSFRGIAGGNSYLTDGNDTTNQFYNENAGRTRISSQISQDAVQEFQVLTNGYSAEFGRASGGVINTVTRSGGNETHGTAYWFFRNQDFSARDRYAAINPKERRDQFGGSLGGAIVKDKLFYFTNIELTRRNFPLINRLINPVLFSSNGDFIGACTAPAAACTAARGIFPRQFQTLERTADTELGFAKIDWRPSERNSFTFSGNYLRWVSPNGIQTQAVLTNGNGIGNNANSTVRTRYGKIGWTSIPTNSIVNEFRFGWFKDRLFDDVNPALIPPVTGRIGLTVQGQSNLGTAVDYPRLNPSEQRFQFVDTLNWTSGKHSWKFGIDFANTQDYLNILRNQFGSYTYASFTDFAYDISRIQNPNGRPLGKGWQSYSQTVGNPILDFTTRDLGLFVQDQFRATQKLTINYGVRYEYANLPQPSQVNPAYPQTGVINSPKNNWAPRLGIAYALNDKTVIRTGYGLFYARFPGALIQTLFFSNGLYQPQVLLQNGDARGPVFPSQLPNSSAGLPGGTVSLTIADKNFRNPYTQQWDLAIERQLTSTLGLTANYIGSRGVRIFTTRDLNIGGFGAPVTYRILDEAGNQTGTYTTNAHYTANRVDPRFQRIVQVENGGNSYYHALALQLNKRMANGLMGSVAYTWSHAIDTANQGGGNNALFFDSIRSTFNGDYSADKGSSSLDQRHRIVITSLWAPQYGLKSSNQMVKWVAANWQFSQITTLASGQPNTATIRVAGAPYAGAAFNTTLNGLGGSFRVPWLPFSTLPLDAIYRTDLRITKILPFSERITGMFNFEAFNISNSQYNTGEFTEAFNLTAGVIRPTIGLGNGTASQGFPDGTNARRAQISFRLIF
ncbi:MAG: TonB-dependent receptor [Acidobacteria bacterium]|nr:TonB-dependent receptor [Acidobacteriota bacterium]